MNLLLWCKLLVQLFLDRSVISINTVRPGTDRQQIVRDALTFGQFNSQSPSEESNTLTRLFKGISNRAEAVHSAGAVFLLANLANLLENKLPAWHHGYENPSGDIRVLRQSDFLGPSVAKFQRQRQVLVNSPASMFCPSWRGSRQSRR